MRHASGFFPSESEGTILLLKQVDHLSWRMLQQNLGVMSCIPIRSCHRYPA